MAITITRTITLGRADADDEYGVTVAQNRRQVHYTPEEARRLAAEILQAAQEAERTDDHDERTAVTHAFDIDDLPEGATP